MQNKNHNKLDDLSTQNKTDNMELTYEELSKSEGILDIGMEEEYQRLLYLMKSYEYMYDYKSKSDFYRQTAKQFRKLSDYKEAKIYAGLCIELAKRSKRDYKKSIYDDAVLRKNKAITAIDYKTAAERFRQVPGYKDADTLALECDKIGGMLRNKATKSLWIRNGIILLMVVALVLLPSTSRAKYYLANAYMYVESYPLAIEKYKKLGSYKDSEERLLECRYLYATKHATNGNYKAAAKELASIGNYKDSERLLVQAQQNIIKNSKLGAKIKIGRFDWIILDISDNKAFLMKNTSINEMPYHSEPIEIAWENSSLRQWLNSDFLVNSFSTMEKDNIQFTEVINIDNEKYKTSGGNATYDHIFILSIQEAKNYGHLFPDFKTNTWLRSPGAHPSSAAFLSENGAIMDYGYIVNSNEFKIRPVMWYMLD